MWEVRWGEVRRGGGVGGVVGREGRWAMLAGAEEVRGLGEGVGVWVRVWGCGW